MKRDMLQGTKQSLWLALIPLVAFWLFSLEIYGQTASSSQTYRSIAAISSLLLGIAVSAISFWRADASIEKKYCAILLPLMLSAWAIPYPSNAGLIVCIAGFAVAFIAPGSRFLWLAGIFSGTILMLESLTISIYYMLAANYHSAEPLASSAAFLLDLTGIQASANGGAVFVLAQDNVFPLSVTFEKLGFYPWILVYVGSLLILFLISKTAYSFLKDSLLVLIASVFYLLVRYVILVQIFFSRDLPQAAGVRNDIFTDPWWLILSFLPLVLLLSRFDISKDLRLDFQIVLDRKKAIALAAAAISVFCLTCSAVFPDTGTEKEGRVLVDEIHSIWESSTLKLDRNWYGENSTYNSYSMIQWLNDSYHVDRVVSPSFNEWNVTGASKVIPDIISDSITDEILNNYDILIIKTPSAYQPSEIEAIVRFVKNGGGLLLIGDHTNFAGTGSNLNQLSERFGIEFGFDAVNTINGRLFYFQREGFVHPVIKYMPYLDFMTGCSLRSPLFGEPVIEGSGLRADPGEFASVGFFRETRDSDPTQVTDTVWGLINQAVAVKYGMGRVVAFADSTVISNFRIFFGGSCNFIIGAMEYLNHSNSSENEKQILFILGMIFACLALILLGREFWGERKIAALLVLLAVASLTASGAMLIFSAKGEETIPCRFYDYNHTVGFDGEHSGNITSRGDTPGEYETFYIWTQRVNLTPVMEERMNDALAKGKALVVIDPVAELSGEDLALLRDYIRGGNCILLMVSSQQSWSKVIEDFGMDTYYLPEPANLVADNTTSAAANTGMMEAVWASKDGLPIKPWGLAVKGGRPLLDIDGRVVLAETDYGTGKFLLFTDSQVFMDGLYGRPGFMGYPKAEPSMVDRESYDLQALYNLEYRIFEEHLGFRKK
ncbi:MAG: ABC-type uncharacterized transport system [Methanosaeta sp. PtaU1.Bin112]|nr:MAG: ABC-type uncharacterized transport system [Methanosaeta sp. PtaU1.Bin112]